MKSWLLFSQSDWNVSEQNDDSRKTTRILFWSFFDGMLLPFLYLFDVSNDGFSFELFLFRHRVSISFVSFIIHTCCWLLKNAMEQPFFSFSWYDSNLGQSCCFGISSDTIPGRMCTKQHTGRITYHQCQPLLPIYLRYFTLTFCCCLGRYCVFNGLVQILLSFFAIHLTTSWKWRRVSIHRGFVETEENPGALGKTLFFSRVSHIWQRRQIGAALPRFVHVYRWQWDLWQSAIADWSRNAKTKPVQPEIQSTQKVSIRKTPIFEEEEEDQKYILDLNLRYSFISFFAVFFSWLFFCCLNW